MSALPAAGPRRRRRHDAPGSALPPAAPVVGLTDAERRATHMVTSLLLDYPRERTVQEESDIDAAVAGLPEPVRTSLAAFREQTSCMRLSDVEAHYVQTFDLKRRCALYLTYYQAGDTRRRGMALVTFVEAYRAAGWEPEPDELPDYLPTVLELSARTADPVAHQLLAAHRDGIEVLRSSLHDLGTPYAHLLDAVCATLPEIDAAAEARLVALINAGPPTETVGLSLVAAQAALAPYGAPGADRSELS
ncbi:nitrate reductase molybdenum cofactor assembly chaperone [Sanguibacter hominis]